MSLGAGSVGAAGSSAVSAEVAGAPELFDPPILDAMSTPISDAPANPMAAIRRDCTLGQPATP